MDHRTKMKAAMMLALAMATTRTDVIVVSDDEEKRESDGELILWWRGSGYEVFNYRIEPMLERAVLDPVEHLLRGRGYERTIVLKEQISDPDSLNFSGSWRRQPNYERAFNQKIPIPRKLGRNMNNSRKGRRQG